MSFNRNSGLRRAVALLCGVSAAALSPTLLAQDQTGADKNIDEVVVTGSRIARPNLESPVPVTTVTAEELFETGSTSVGDLLNDLPALRSTYGQSNSSRFLGTTGLNLLDLRGLGTQRTLVLVNGRRHVGADILNNAVSPDVNTFPTDLIERIDVVTGGSSAVYGSDAIAGVVNFVLKKNYEGLQFRGQGSQSAESDGGNYYASVLAGTNFLDDRGNIAVNFEYAKQEPFFASDRDNLSSNGNFVLDQQDPLNGAGVVNGSDGTPDRNYYSDIRFVTLSNGGSILFPPVQPMGGSFYPCGAAPNVSSTTGFRAPYSCAHLFTPEGTLIPQEGRRIGFGPNGNFDGGNGTNNREDKLLAIYPKLERYSLNVIGNLEISEAFTPFVEAKYIRTESKRFGGPAFFTGSTTGDFVDPTNLAVVYNRERPRFDNPYLTVANQAQINAARAQAGFTTPLAGAAQFTLGRNLAEFGPRSEEATRETARIVLGVGGKVSENWSYEVAGNYGQFREDTVVLGNMNVQRFALAMNSARNASGNIVCRSEIDPLQARPWDPFLPFSVATLAADVAACQPLNPFGEGNISQAAKDYILQDTTSVAKIDQVAFTASLTGDSSALFSLPAGPIGIAIGFEHREDKIFFEADELVSSGITFYNALPLLDPPTQKVDELFAEFRIPLLAEMTAAQELTLNLSGRYSEYNGETGGVIAYNGSLEYMPIDGLRFRAGLARAVRAPNLSDLFSEQSQNFAAINDPCSSRFIGGGSPTRRANCLAAGIPVTYDQVYLQTPEILSGGNPDLVEETSDSLTIGLVWQPSFLKGVNLSIDYFDIDIDDVITAPTAQQIMDACYDAPTLTNPFCGLFQRWGAAGGPGFDGTANSPLSPYALINATLQQTQLNYASFTARGVDVELGYAGDLGNLGRFDTRAVYTKMLQIDDFLDPANPNRPDQVLLELGDPENAFNWNTNFETGKLTFGYQMRYIGRQFINLAEDVSQVGDRPPQNADYASKKYYHGLFYHDVRVGMDVTDTVNAYLGVDNLADRVPPLGLTGTGGGSGIYESRGRYFYAGVKLSF